jgi:hypothetical protein
MPINYTVVALPRSVALDAAFHVALFISPRLSPDGKLGDFDPVARWAQTISDPATQITLTDQTGQPYAIEAALPDDPRYWKAVFPPSTPVRAWKSRSLHGRTLQSYAAETGPLVAQGIHTASFASSPIDPPSPAISPAVQIMDRIAREFGAFRETPEGMVYDESRATETFDRFTDGGLSSISTGATTTRGPAVGGAFGGFVAVLGELHRARRFFERPESAQAYKARPDRASRRLSVPERDFHERLTLLGDQPALLRRLGLIIPLRVLEPQRLAGAQWLTASIFLTGLGDRTLPTRVLCRAIGDNLVTVGRDGGDWRDGRLRLGDTARFTTLDLDPDASALKLDRYLWTAPRLSAQHAKGEPVNAAPPTLRGHGFGVVRRAHAQQLGQRQQAAATATEPALAAFDQPFLRTEDVARGMRIEVWDDTETRWFSLHAREGDVRVKDLAPLGVHDEGWIQSGTAQETQGVANGKVYVHEQLFGWSGWSLAAPHPGLTLEHTYDSPSTDPDDPERNERLGDPSPPKSPQLHVVTTWRAEKGTLPRLRYGRSYALRAWVVDLAGGSPDHVLPEPGPPPVLPLLDIAEQRLSQPPAPAAGASLDDLVQALRSEASAVATPEAPPTGGIEAAMIRLADELDGVLASGDEDVRTLVLARADQRLRATGPGAGEPSRRLAVERAVAPLLFGREPLVADPTGWNPAALVAAVTSQISGDPVDDFDLVLDTTTPLRPLLRWHPVDPPVLVPRAPYSEGESLRQLVVRSGIKTRRDPELGDTITVTDVASWAAAASAAHPGVKVDYPTACERHVAAPKISQFEAELQGRFDAAMSPGAERAERRRALLVARREAGTFLDTSIPRIDQPTGKISLPWVKFVDPPDADGPVPDIDALPRGHPLAPGQYVIHDTNETLLPYLPDPMVRGLSMVFPEAGRDRPLRPPISIEGTTADYAGLDRWPDVQPFRIVFKAGRPLAANVGGRTISVALPAADVLRVRLSSSIDRAKLDQFGFWRSLPQEVRDSAAVREAAADGWLWPLSPAEEVVLVHAVPKPLAAPTFLILNPWRGDADTGVLLSGAVDVHGPSTERLEVEATWTQQEDDVAQPCPDDVDPPKRHAVACTLPILDFEDIAMLGPMETEIDVPGAGKFRFQRARHEFGDTRHRVVDYRCRATTRFREYFHPGLLADPDDRSVIGAVRRVRIPSSARPAKPSVRQVLPMFRWEEESEPEQPFGLRRRRRAGVRIYLDRPWYSSGDGELLGVVLGELGDEADRADATSQWGADPVWHGGGPARRAISLELDQLLATLERELPARPVRPLEQLPLVDLVREPKAGVLGYRPEFDKARRLWFVDIAIDPGAAIWPFLQLVVARYQPDSLAGKHLSPLLRCDYVQIPLERTAAVTRPDDRTARVVLSGPAGYRGSADLTATGPVSDEQLAAIRNRIEANRYLRVILERRSTTIGTDLGWETVDQALPILENFDLESLTATWVGQLDLLQSIPARRPGGDSRWRVTIEETELLDADFLDDGGWISHEGRPLLPRMVYLDHLPL